MYKLLFAEDESATREGVLENVDWQSLGITNVKAAKNGLLAYEIAQTFLPDILLTDIKMPRMNGIELAKKIRELNPDCSILIISSHSEVDYLKSAIKLNALDFIDKPLKLDLLSNLIQKAVALQDQIHAQRIQIKKQLSQIVTNGPLDIPYIEKAITAQYPALSLPLQLQSLCFCIYNKPLCEAEANLPISPKTNLDTFKDPDALLKKISLLFDQHELSHILHFSAPDLLQVYIAKDLFQNSIKCTQIYDEVNALIQPNETQTLQLYLMIASSLQELTHFPDTSIHHKCAEWIFFHEDIKIFSYKDLSEHKSSDPLLFQSEMKAFGEALEMRYSKEATQIVKDITQYFCVQPDYHKDVVIQVYYTFMIQILRLVTNSSDQIHTDSVWHKLFECHYLLDAQYHLLQYMSSVMSTNQPSTSYNDALVDSIIKIIHTHYADKNLSLDEISRMVYLSPSYICVKFKKGTQKTLVQFIHEYRIHASLELLENPLRKLNEIGEAVGFDNGNYYSKIFKKYMNISPADYRQK